MFWNSIFKQTVVLVLVGSCFSVTTLGQDTAFTYQGELKQGGNLVSGPFDMEFSLWDAVAGGNQIDATIIQNGGQVVDGKFSVELDFGAESFDNSGRWLEIVVAGSTLSPRNPITRSPYSVQTRGIFVDESERVGVGTANPAARLDVISDTANTGNNTARFRAPSLGSNTSHIHYGLSGSWFIRSASDFGDVVIQDTGGRVGIGTSNPSSEAKVTLSAGAGDKSLFALAAADFNPTIHSLNIGLGEAFWAEGTSDFAPALLAENNGTGLALQAIGGIDTEPDRGGVIVIGDETGANLSMDRNEIMARNDGSTSTLYLNADGGDIKMGTQQTHPAYAYGRINDDGVLMAGSPNITNVEVVGNSFWVSFEDGFLETDVAIATDSREAGQGGAAVIVQLKRDGNRLRISTWDHVNIWDDRRGCSFVIYRH